MAGSVAERLYRQAKSGIYSVPLARDVAMTIRGAQVERTYARWRSHYARVSAPDRNPEEWLAERSRVALQRARLSRPRILFVGTDPGQDYGGLLQGLAGECDLTVFHQADGRYGQLNGRGELSFSLTTPNSARLLDLVRHAFESGRAFDLLLGQLWAGYTDPNVIAHLRATYRVIVVNIGMDDRHAFEKQLLGRHIGTRLLSAAIDLQATAAPECVEWFAAEGCPAIFFPEASSPDVYRPMPELGKTVDVSFVGARYGMRGELVEALSRAGLNCVAYGNGWPLGRLDLADVPPLFARSRVVLGVGTIGHSKRLMSLKLRDFDGPMSGSCYVTSDNPDLASLYEIGREVCVYKDVADCVRIITDLVHDEDRREQIARTGRARALRDHTWSNRFRHLMSMLRSAKARL